jgi:hypothetical protein
MGGWFAGSFGGGGGGKRGSGQQQRKQLPFGNRGGHSVSAAVAVGANAKAVAVAIPISLSLPVACHTVFSPFCFDTECNSAVLAHGVPGGQTCGLITPSGSSAAPATSAARQSPMSPVCASCGVPLPLTVKIVSVNPYVKKPADRGKLMMSVARSLASRLSNS